MSCKVLTLWLSARIVSLQCAVRYVRCDCAVLSALPSLFFFLLCLSCLTFIVASKRVGVKLSKLPSELEVWLLRGVAFNLESGSCDQSSMLYSPWPNCFQSALKWIWKIRHESMCLSRGIWFYKSFIIQSEINVWEKSNPMMCRVPESEASCFAKIFSLRFCNSVCPENVRGFLLLLWAYDYIKVIHILFGLKDIQSLFA